MKRQFLILLLFSIVVLLYGMFVSFYSRHSEDQIRKEMNSHAVVVEQDVWTLNRQGPLNYLALAAARDNYAKMAIQLKQGEELVSLDGPKLTGLNKVFDQMGLFPMTPTEKTRDDW